MTHQAARVLVATQIEGFYKIPPNHPELDDFRMETHGTHGDFGIPPAGYLAKGLLQGKSRTAAASSYAHGRVLFNWLRLDLF